MRMMMKSVMAGALVSLATMAVPGAANALPCGTVGTDNALSNFVDAVGASNGRSCAVGDKTFSAFTYQPDGFNGLNGHSNVPASSVGVGPAITPDIGIGFNAFWNNAGTTAADALLSFRVTSPRANIVDFQLQLDGVLGSVLDVATLSNGVVLSSNDNLLHRSPLFAPVATLVVIDDIGVNPGGTISSVEKQFSQVPEPASLAILGISLLGMGAAFRRFRK